MSSLPSLVHNQQSGTTLFLVRHAHTAMAGRFCGHSDPELSQEGVSQLPNLVTRLARFSIDHICTSDLIRARQTAAALAEARRLLPQLRPGLRELHFGLWEGLSWDEIEARDPSLAARWIREYPELPAPEGELFSTFCERVENELQVIASEWSGQSVAVVTHAGFIRTALFRLLRRHSEQVGAEGPDSELSPSRSFKHLEASDLEALDLGYGAITQVCQVDGRWIIVG